MKEVMAIIRMNKMNQTKQALADAGIASFTARKVIGRGKGKVDYLLMKGAEAGCEEAIVPARPRTEADPQAHDQRRRAGRPGRRAVVQTIIEVNQTGHPGDGKIFVMPLLDALRIRTGESGEAALDETLLGVSAENACPARSPPSRRRSKSGRICSRVSAQGRAEARRSRSSSTTRQAHDAVPEILANVRTTPGIITQRGCTYAGCKGVVLGPTRDIVNITHGPIGCGFYSWLTRRNQTRPPTAADDNFMTYCFSTDMQEEEIIFGGEKKLRAAIQEAYRPVPSQGDRACSPPAPWG